MKKILSLILSIICVSCLFTGCATLEGIKDDLGLNKTNTTEIDEYEKSDNVEVEYSNYLNFDHISLPYSDEWEENNQKLASGKTTTTIQKDGYHFYFQATTYLYETEDYLGKTFDTQKGKDAIFESFEDLYTNTAGITAKTKKELTQYSDKLWYCIFTYDDNANAYSGTIFVLVYPDANLIVSANLIGKNTKKIEKEFLNMFDNAIVDSVIVDNELYEFTQILDDKKENENKYVNNTGKYDVTLEGEWETTSGSKMGYKFEDGRIYWYQDIYDQSDYYWAGDAKITKGYNKVQKKYGLSEEFENAIQRQGIKKGQYEVYGVSVNYDELIKDGYNQITKSDKEVEFIMIWIIIDNGTDGIEAQTLRINDYDIQYFDKIN